MWINRLLYLHKWDSPQESMDMWETFQRTIVLQENDPEKNGQSAQKTELRLDECPDLIHIGIAVGRR